jgi:hypothetical protein
MFLLRTDKLRDEYFEISSPYYCVSLRESYSPYYCVSLRESYNPYYCVSLRESYNFVSHVLQLKAISEMGLLSLVLDQMSFNLIPPKRKPGRCQMLSITIRGRLVLLLSVLPILVIE